jgi:uncharacterized damage-inducible protein DinB
MTWTAPLVERASVPNHGDERELLDAFLEFHRQTLLWKCSGLTGEQLAHRAVPTTTMTLLGIVRHITDVERLWLRQVASGEAPDTIYWDKPDRDSDFDDATADHAERDYATYLAELDVCRANQTLDLDATVVDPDNGETFTFRWIMTHLIEEYARHNGHADLIREAIDGSTGE